MEHECLVIKDGIVKGIRKDLDRTCIKEVKIPEGVTEIDAWAFVNCESLESVTIPEGVTNIEDLAFEGCKALKSVEIPASVTRIGGGAFVRCESLENAKYGGTLAQWCALSGVGWLMDVAKNVTLVGEDNLDLRKLTTLKIPECVTEIDEWAFEDCEALKSVVIPASVTRIGEGAFDGCENLESAKYGGTLAQWCALDGGGWLTSVAKSMVLAGEDNMDLKKLTALKIPEGVTDIESHAFIGCESLESVEIPANVTGIGFYAFDGCDRLESAKYGGTLAQWCALDGGGWLTSVAKSMVLVGENDMDLKKLTTLKIPEGVTYIKRCAFEGCDNLKGVEIPASVKRIGSRAFYRCMNIESVMISEGVTRIEWFAFSGCKALKSVVIPASVTIAFKRAFDKCESLESVTIPASIRDISDSMFEECKSLKRVTIPDGITRIGEQAFCDCESLESVEIPASVKSVGYNAFNKCKSLKVVNYGGTKAQWKQIRLEDCGRIGKFIVHCTDGDITVVKGKRCGKSPSGTFE